MKILVKGYYGFGNLGDDVLMLVTYQTLRAGFPGAVIDVFSNNNPNLREFSKEPGYNNYIGKILQNKPSIIDWTSREQYDWVVDGGGGVFFGHKKGTSLHLFFNFFIRFLGSKVVYWIDRIIRMLTGKRKHIQFSKRTGVGIGIGEYTSSSPLLYDHFTEIGSFDVLFVRDEESKLLLEKYQFQRAHVFSDLAFDFKHWLPQPVQKKRERQIAVVLLDFSHDPETQIDQVLAWELEAIHSGYSVTYFSIDDVKDVIFREKTKHRDLVCWEPTKQTMHSFLSKLQEFPVVISARAHGAILGACMEVVPVIIPHSQKLRQVAKMFPGLGRNVSLCPERKDLLNTIDYVFDNLETCRDALMRDVQANQSKTQKMLQRLVVDQ